MNKIFIAAIAAAFTLASCSSEGDGPEGPRSQQILGHIEKVLLYKVLKLHLPI